MHVWFVEGNNGKEMGLCFMIFVAKKHGRYALRAFFAG
jgi:hypothetical protein